MNYFLTPPSTSPRHKQTEHSRILVMEFCMANCLCTFKHLSLGRYETVKFAPLCTKPIQKRCELCDLLSILDLLRVLSHLSAEAIGNLSFWPNLADYSEIWLRVKWCEFYYFTPSKGYQVQSPGPPLCSVRSWWVLVWAILEEGQDFIFIG